MHIMNQRRGHRRVGGKKNNKDAPTTTSLVWSLSFGAQSICCHFWKKVRFSFTTHQQWYCKYWLSIQSVSQSFFYWTLEGIFICWDLVRWATLIIGLGRAWLQTNTWESGGWVGVVVCALNAEKVDKCGGRDNNNNSFYLGLCGRVSRFVYNFRCGIMFACPLKEWGMLIWRGDSFQFQFH